MSPPATVAELSPPATAGRIVTLSPSATVVPATGEPDVLVVDVDVDEAVQRTILDQSVTQPAVPAVQIGDHLGEGAARLRKRSSPPS